MIYMNVLPMKQFKTLFCVYDCKNVYKLKY